MKRLLTLASLMLCSALPLCALSTRSSLCRTLWHAGLYNTCWLWLHGCHGRQRFERGITSGSIVAQHPRKTQLLSGQNFLFGFCGLVGACSTAAGGGAILSSCCCGRNCAAGRCGLFGGYGLRVCLPVGSAAHNAAKVCQHYRCHHQKNRRQQG